MARRKFPSDRRPWFRCLADILHDEKLNGDCPPDVAWAYMRLLAMLQNTGSRDGKISLDKRALAFLTCRAQHRHALCIVRALAERSLCTMSARGVHIELTVAKWAKLQGFATSSNGPRGEERRGEERERTPAKPAPRPRARKSTPKTTCPSELTPGQRDQVKAWRDRKHPELDDLELAAQWDRFTDHYIGDGVKKADWLRTFYKWLTGPYYKRLAPGAPVRRFPIVEREPRPDPPTEAELESAIADSRKARSGFRGARLHSAAGGA